MMYRIWWWNSKKGREDCELVEADNLHEAMLLAKDKSNGDPKSSGYGADQVNMDTFEAASGACEEYW